ncbi:DUF6504 family protein [Deinococcus sonorensis]|uniref:DUF6504 family protein n=2 Tax=Deinococcus sonorensis TaxID=309891 RepID=A0AAU7UGM7_9DEIO
MRDTQIPLDDVTVDRSGRPVRFRYQGRLQVVRQQLDDWRTGGRWWLDEPPRDCYLVETAQVLAELHREDPPSSRWWLARIQD